MFKDLLKKFRAGEILEYEEAKELASSDDIKVRRDLAQHKNAQPEILYYLAEDPSPKVRGDVAANKATPRQADIILTNDDDEQVRSQLASKIATLAPGLSENEVDKIRQLTYESLEILARDQATKVRAILSEALKDVADAPPAVIRRLAKDVELVVCAPVLENSPVLTDQDLLEIIDHGPAFGALSAIARRNTLPDDVMEALFAADDEQSVVELLKNDSITIKDPLLEKICEKARFVDIWHNPLVMRPKLPKTVALRLADFVADNLIEVLLKRSDLDEKTAKTIRDEVAWRLDAAAEDEAVAEGESPEDEARYLYQDGKLDRDTVFEALTGGRNAFVSAALALLSSVSTKTVDKIIDTSSAKGIVSLCWKAELSPEDAVEIQQRLGRIQPRDQIKPSAGKFALSADEMNWQLEFFQS